MKKHLLKAALLGTAMLLAGCGAEQSSTTVTSTTSSTSEGPKYHSVWGDENAEAIVGTLGIDLPLMPSCKFDIDVLEDDYGDPLVAIYCYVDENSVPEALDEYANICIQNGYDVEYETVMGWNPDNPMEKIYYNVYFADKVFTPIKGVEMQILEGKSPVNGKECMGIFAYNWTYVNPDCWPSALVEELLTYDIPHPEHHEGYQYAGEIYAEDEYTYECVWIGIKGIDAYIEEEYAEMLSSASYEVVYYGYDEETFEYIGYYAYPTDCDDHVIQFGQTNYGLEIMIYRTY